MTRFLVPEPRESVTPGEPPEFSVIIPTYQSAGTVAVAVESALEQTYPAKEVVVCDDGSTDDPAAALAAYSDRIILFRQENAGPSAARNAAIVRASGDFVVNLDADDVLHPGNLAARAELLTMRPDLDIVCTDGGVELDGTVLRHLYRSDWSFETDDQRRAILERCFICPFWAVRRSRAIEIGGFDDAITHCEDWDLWIRLVTSGSRAGLVDESLGGYRLHHGSQSTEALKLIAGRIVTMEKAIGSGELTEEETALLRRMIAEERVEQSLTRAREALLARSPDARRESLRLLRDSSLPPEARLRAGIAWATPGLARRVLARRGRETAAGVVLPIE